ncbi:MAG: hypothetical protein ABSH50_28235 [Bryobacteraceae bacterium]
MTFQIPDELARALIGIAAAQKKCVEQLAVDRLQSLVEKPTSPQAVLRVLRALRVRDEGPLDEPRRDILTGHKRNQ